ncbi:MAG: amidohydrolase family protein, partial [Lachnospiraceae bacterium]|nr:amidohydrolase family protein [Lachnospiraceae bacterium]
RGVLFDVAHGGGNFSFDIAERAMGEGFFPDIISSDMTIQTWNRQPLCSLTQVMSKFLMLGMTMPEIIRAVTATPARALNMSGRVGTLAPGACGDVTLLSLERGEFDFVDVLGKHRRGETLLVPKATFANGMLVYREPVFAAAL